MGLGFVDVLEKAETRLNSVLPSYQKIFNIFNLETESKAILDKGYGIYYGPMRENFGATGHLTSDGELIVALTNFLNMAGEDNQDKISAVYTDVETLIRSFMDGSRLGSSVLIKIDEYSLSQPIPFAGNEYIRIEITFNVLFRETL